MHNQKRKRYQKDSAPADDIITLIHLVRQNPLLYNYKMQPNQRRRSDILNGWAEIASQIGRYTVQECRRKWKNLRDTYHQYRLRKPKIGDGLAKWRYAKELEFLSNVYQPKLKSHRHLDSFNTHHVIQGVTTHEQILDHHQLADNDDDMVQTHHHHHRHGSVTLVNDENESFILAPYEESVNGDVSAMEQTGHHDDQVHYLTAAPDDDDVEGIVKNEHVSPLDVDEDIDEDGAAGTEVDYEEVCLYEEAGAGGVTVTDACETIISTVQCGRATTIDSKDFQFIDSNFCISSALAATTTTTTATNSSPNKSLLCRKKGKAPESPGVALVTTTAMDGGTATISSTSPLVHFQTTAGGIVATTTSSVSGSDSVCLGTNTFVGEETREELDLFFDFLKKKMQHFAKDEITSIQIEFLNCVLRREGQQKD